MQTNPSAGCIALGLSLLLLCGAVIAADDTASATAKPQVRPGIAAAKSTRADSESSAGQASEHARVLTRKGVRVEFSAKPVGTMSNGTTVREGDFAEVTFRIVGESGETPVQGLYPGVWVDLAKTLESTGPRAMDCKDRVALYLQGTVGMRPMVDLNSYFILVMTRGGEISVIDPFVGITGITNLFASIHLKGAGGDWAKTRDQQRLYVSIPKANQVAVADLQTFKVTQYVDVGINPLRVALQPDEKYLWVAHQGKPGKAGGVTVIDRESLQPVAEISTGQGHHELAFSDDSRHAFVTNRTDGTVSVIDVQQLKKVRDIGSGGVPISLDFSHLSRALYIADSRTGVVSVVDSDRHEVVARIETKRGLGPLHVTEDGRWALVVNTPENVVYVIDTSTNTLAHTVPVGERPYQIAFSRAFAYVRSLGTERVSMIHLSDLAKTTTPIVNQFAAGRLPPEKAGELSIADAMTPTGQEAAMLVVGPADNTVYFYMEGMNAPMGAFRNYGFQPRAVEITDRSLKERAPGVYTGTFRIPQPGVYDVAFLMETPEILHCFSFTAEANPDIEHTMGRLAVNYLTKDRIVQAGGTVKLRFRLSSPVTGELRSGLRDVSVMYFRAPNFDRTLVPATEVEDGIYEATLTLRHQGAYFAYIGVPSENISHGTLPYVSLRTTGKLHSRQVTPATPESEETVGSDSAVNLSTGQGGGEG